VYDLYGLFSYGVMSVHVYIEFSVGFVVFVQLESKVCARRKVCTREKSMLEWNVFCSEWKVCAIEENPLERKVCDREESL
jgi:hypothetical protein